MLTLKGIIDYDLVNYKEPCLTLIFPYCTFKCDKLNGCKVCQNEALSNEPIIQSSCESVYNYFKSNPLTKAICCQGLEPLDSKDELLNFISFVRKEKKDNSLFIIYTGYERKEQLDFIEELKEFPNIIIKWGRFIMNEPSHYDELLGVFLSSSNQYSEKVS